jgi:hypothetical protein
MAQCLLAMAGNRVVNQSFEANMKKVGLKLFALGCAQDEQMVDMTSWICWLLECFKCWVANGCPVLLGDGVPSFGPGLEIDKAFQK